MSRPDHLQAANLPRPILRQVVPEYGDALLGKNLGVYEVRRLIGRGGMGDVYEGFHPFLERKAALKVISPELARTDRARARFEREARSAARIRHPHAITIYDFGSDHGRPYLAMEFLDGDDLESVLAWEGRLSPARFLAVFRPVCEGVQAAHAQRVIHRDLKPSNIFLDKCAAGQEVVKVVDFGLARLLDETDKRITGGKVVGTPSYISPEQLLGQDVGPRSDVYSLGVIAFQCFTGTLPFADNGDLGDLWHRIANTLPAMERFDAWHGPVAEVVGRALSKFPGERQASPMELFEDLSEAASRIERPRTSMPLMAVAPRQPMIATTTLPPAPALGPPPAAPVQAPPIPACVEVRLPPTLLRLLVGLTAACAAAAALSAAAAAVSLLGN